MVTCFSCIASRRADCTLEGARLISSARTMFANMGPRLTWNSPDLGLKIKVPIRSAGSRSGVNWMRLNWQLMALDRAFTAVVLASPGTPSSSTCPSARTPISSFSSMFFWPMTVRPTSSRMFLMKAPSRFTFSVMAWMSTLASALVDSVMLVFSRDLEAFLQSSESVLEFVGLLVTAREAGMAEQFPQLGPILRIPSDSRAAGRGSLARQVPVQQRLEAQRGLLVSQFVAQEA